MYRSYDSYSQKQEGGESCSFAPLKNHRSAILSQECHRSRLLGVSHEVNSNVHDRKKRATLHRSNDDIPILYFWRSSLFDTV